MGSPWRDKISLAILDLQEKGEIQMLYDKWWKNPDDTCIREDKTKMSKVNALGVDNIGGVFVVLLCGLALAVLIAIIEFCQNSKKSNVPGGVRQSMCSEMTEELCYALRCHGSSQQRPSLKRECPKCSRSTSAQSHMAETTFMSPGNVRKSSTVDISPTSRRSSLNLNVPSIVEFHPQRTSSVRQYAHPRTIKYPNVDDFD